MSKSNNIKQQQIKSNKQKKKPVTILDDRTPKTPPQIVIDPAIANKPVRMVNYVEVGDMPTKQVQFMMQELNRVHDSAKGGIHYFLPIRHGKIGTDVYFEQEWEDIINEMCEINDEGKIVLKNGAKDVHVVRTKL